MINHITLYVSDTDKSKKFYEQTLKPLGYEVADEGLDNSLRRVGFTANGQEGYWDFWIKQAPVDTKPTGPLSCLAFQASSKEMVNAFYEAGLAAGGKDNGPPGPRRYHPDYYSAFVLDPDGNNIEVVLDYLSE